MRIAVLCMSLTRNAGGLFYSVKNLTKHTEINDIHLQIFSGAEKSPYMSDDLETWDTKRNPIIVKKYKPYSFGYMPKLYEQLKSFKPDIIHIHGIWSYHALVAAKYKKINPDCRLVVSPRGMLDEWSLGTSRLKKFIARMFYVNQLIKSADLFHVLSEREKKSVIQIRKNAKILISPNGVLPGDIPDIKKRDDKKLNILYLGRLHKKKGIEIFLKSIARMPAESLNDIRLRVVGWGQKNYVDHLNHLVDHLKLGNTVIFLGQQYGKEKDDILQSSDVFVLPSLSEGLPMSVLEAWSAGLPTLITRNCGFDEEMNQEFVFEIGHNEGVIREQIARLLKLTKVDLFNLGLLARQHVQSKYSWNEIGAEMASAYRSIIK